MKVDTIKKQIPYVPDTYRPLYQDIIKPSVEIPLTIQLKTEEVIMNMRNVLLQKNVCLPLATMHTNRSVSYTHLTLPTKRIV